MWQFTNPDARPISEYLSDYHSARKARRFLFYCRECIRNFDSFERVSACDKCGNKEVLELPKDVKFKAKHKPKRYSSQDAKRDLAKAAQDAAVALANVRHALWRGKIALYYISTSVSEELK